MDSNGDFADLASSSDHQWEDQSGPSGSPLPENVEANDDDDVGEQPDTCTVQISPWEFVSSVAVGRNLERLSNLLRGMRDHYFSQKWVVVVLAVLSAVPLDFILLHYLYSCKKIRNYLL